MCIAECLLLSTERLTNCWSYIILYAILIYIYSLSRHSNVKHTMNISIVLFYCMMFIFFHSHMQLFNIFMVISNGLIGCTNFSVNRKWYGRCFVLPYFYLFFSNIIVLLYYSHSCHFISCFLWPSDKWPVCINHNLFLGFLVSLLMFLLKIYKSLQPDV